MPRKPRCGATTVGKKKSNGARPIPCSARVAFRRMTGSLSFTISDQGAGFDWRRYLDFDPERVFDPNGRGIAMARQATFSSVEYLERGNIVVATIAVPGTADR